MSNMQASIVLDQPGNTSYTNLDQISGKVVVRCGKSADIESIIVKLEGESRTRLLSPTGPHGEKAKPQLEYHKVCYAEHSAFLFFLLTWLDTIQGAKSVAKRRAYGEQKLVAFESGIYAREWES